MHSVWGPRISKWTFLFKCFRAYQVHQHFHVSLIFSPHLNPGLAAPLLAFRSSLGSWGSLFQPTAVCTSQLPLPSAEMGVLLSVYLQHWAVATALAELHLKPELCTLAQYLPVCLSHWWSPKILSFVPLLMVLRLKPGMLLLNISLMQPHYQTH